MFKGQLYILNGGEVTEEVPKFSKGNLTFLERYMWALKNVINLSAGFIYIQLSRT